MDSKERAELTKIGFIALIGLIALLSSVFWLKGHKLHNYAQYTFYFKDVNGLEEGALMRWNGLKVGVVESVSPVFTTQKIEGFPGEKLIELGRKHLKLAEKALATGGIEDLSYARKYINEGQLEIALGQASNMQTEIRRGQHVKVKAVLTVKDVPIGLLNQVSIVPSGLLGEQYLDITTLYQDEDFNDPRFKDMKSQFVVLEPIRLERLVRTNIESAEAVRDLTNRFNAVFSDEDAEVIRQLMASFNDLAGDPRFRENIKESVKNFKDFNLFDLFF